MDYPRTFEWDEDKNKLNHSKHGVYFEEAQLAFEDPNRLVFQDNIHSKEKELRYYCIGKIGNKVCTVRYTHRDNKIRIFGAGYWRKERKIYEKNQNR